ncbi:MAG: N-acetylmuramoyl-L-alanine amidase, partial [Bacteroidales bacterium]
MKKNYFITFLLFIMSILAYGQIKDVKYDEENRLHHIQIIELSDSLNRPANINLIKTPIEFTSLAFAWDIYDNVALNDIIVNYRVHKPEKGWSEWKQSTASFAPNENKWNLYFTDLLFGLDEGLHDSISFYFIIPQDITCHGIYLVLQDLSPQLDEPVIRNNSEGILLTDRSCPELPTMIQRSTWCGSYSACHNPTFTPTNISPSHVIIHHGGSPDSYTDGAAVVRSYWNYHVNTLGYDDIAYNYLFDKSGNMYVGRYNPDLPNSDVKGAHSGVSNQYSIGLCYLGNTDATGNNPTTAQNNKCTHFMAWWFDHKGFDPTESANILCQDNVTRNLPRICGKRDVNPGDVSPGNILYNSLPTLRTTTKNIIDSCTSGSSVPTNLVATPLGCPNNEVQFTWQNSGTGWYIQVSTSSSFPLSSTYIKWVSGLTTYTGPSGFVLQSDGTTPLGSFLSNTLYYWRIYYGSGNYTTTYSFTTLNCAPQVNLVADPETICNGENSVLTASGAD